MSSAHLREFPNLNVLDFQHPHDVTATERIKKIPLLGTLIKTMSKSYFEKEMRLFLISGAIRLSETQGYSLYNKVIKPATILNLPKLPEVYIQNKHEVNAFSFGVENYCITLYSGLIDSLTEEELLAVIGHELGHVKCNHQLYKTMATMMTSLGLEVFSSFLPGIGAMAAIPLQLAILHWARMAELSCDRAALLVVQNPEIVASMLCKLCGGSEKILPEISIDSALEQAKEYEDTSDTFIEKIIKVRMLLLETHPFPIIRAKEIINWSSSREYRHILSNGVSNHQYKLLETSNNALVKQSSEHTNALVKQDLESSNRALVKQNVSSLIKMVGSIKTQPD